MFLTFHLIDLWIQPFDLIVFICSFQYAVAKGTKLYWNDWHSWLYRKAAVQMPIKYNYILYIQDSRSDDDTCRFLSKKR